MKIRRARNQIEKIQVDGQEVKGTEELKSAAHKHFKNLLSAKEETVEYENFLQHTKKINQKRPKRGNVQRDNRRRGSGGHMEPTSTKIPSARWFYNNILQIPLE